MPQNHIGENVDAVAFVKQLDMTNEAVIPDTGTVIVKTAHSEYIYDATNHRIKGGVVGPEFRPGKFHGTTFGGSMIMVGKLLPGALLEFSVATDEGYEKVYTSSPMISIEVIEGTN